MRCVRVSDCGINAHKHCKDLVVMECRNKQQSAGNKRPDVVPNGQCNRTYYTRTVSCSGRNILILTVFLFFIGFWHIKNNLLSLF